MPYKRATYPGPGIPVQPSPPQRRDQSSPPLDRAARLSCHAPPRTLWTAAAFVAANASAEFVEGASAAVSSRGHASSRTWRSCRSIAVRLRVWRGGPMVAAEKNQVRIKGLKDSVDPNSTSIPKMRAAPHSILHTLHYKDCHCSCNFGVYKIFRHCQISDG